MYRHRFYTQVLYGHFPAALTVWEQLNELARSRGWAESTFWVPTVGVMNELVVETGYPDLAAYQRQTDAFFSDPEAMKLFRSLNEFVAEGSGHDELYETAPHIA